MTYEVHKMIDMYRKGMSINSIARELNTYPTTVRRILVKNNIELRHDSMKKGDTCVKDGEKLIEWAKAQGRLVTKAELATLLGRTKLSPSYFIKYPELGQYIKGYCNHELTEYSNYLYNWLKENKIPYKPNDRTKLKVSVTALLLSEYSDIAIQIIDKPSGVSIKRHSQDMELKKQRAEEVGINLIFLSKKHFENLDEIKILLNSLVVEKD